MIKESSKISGMDIESRSQLNSSCSQTAGRLVMGHYLLQRSFQGQFWNTNDHKIPPSLTPPRSKVFLPKVPGLLHSFCYSKIYTCCHSFWKVIFFFFFLNHPLLSSEGIWYKSDRVLGFLSSLQRPRKLPILALWVCCLVCSTKESLLLCLKLWTFNERIQRLDQNSVQIL